MGRGWVYRISGLVVLVRLFTGEAGADAADVRQYRGKPVVEVHFEPAQQPLTPEYLNNLLPFKTGAPLRTQDLRETIKRLFATGRYQDVVIAGQPRPAGVALFIRTSDRLFVGRVEAEGKIKLPPNRGQIVNSAQLNLGAPFSQEDLLGAVSNIQELLKRNGFFQAQVKPEITHDPEHQQANVRFFIEPGKRARYGQPVITGNPRMEAEDVADATKWKGWFRRKPVTQETTQNGLQRVRRKYESKERLLATVRLEDMEFHPDTETVTPKLRVEGGPKVTVETVGAKVSKSKLKRYVPVYDEGVADRDLIVEGASNLRDYFQSQGYFDAEVDFQEKPATADKMDIVYVVNLGPRQKLVHVEVNGNRYFNTDTIRERMFLQPAGLLRLRHGRYSAGFVRRDTKAIESLYESNGFRDVKVGFRTLDDYQGKAGDMGVIVNIQEGPQYRVSSFKVNGISQVPADQILPTLASIEGQPYSESNIAMDRDFILGVYRAAGFIQTTFDWTMQPGPGPHEVQLQYRITEGRRRYVRDVLIAGLYETNQRLVRPNVEIHAGEPLSMQDMTTTQRNLYELGIFDKVDMAIQNPEGDTDSKYVLYQIEEGHRYSVAAGFGAEVARIGGSQNSLDNPAGQTGFSPRGSLEISRYNMFGLGHTLTLKNRVSTLERRFVLDYLAPRYRNVEGRNITITGLYDDSRDVRTFSAKRLEGSAQLSQRFSKALTALWNFSYRRVSVDQNSLKINPQLIPILSQPVRIGMVSSNFIHDRRDNPTDSHRGIYSTADLGVASNVFGSARSFLRFLGRNSSYHSLGPHIVLARSLQFGLIKPFRVAPDIDPNQSIPLPERFYGGGGTSHRGFPDNQAGPRDPFTGFPIGGNAVLFHNTELRFPLIGDNINGVLFHDMGNVYKSLTDVNLRFHQRTLTDFNYMVHAVGFGIRYHTPVGPVRVDLAYSVNPPKFVGFKGTLQELLFNQGTRTQQQISHFQFFFSIGQTF